MNKFVPAEVYDNLIKLFTYRNCVMTSEQLSRQKLVEHLNHHEYIMMLGNRSANDVRGAADIAYILIAPNSKYSNKSGDFTKLLRILPKVAAGKRLEVLFVSDTIFTIHIKKVLIKYREANPGIMLEDYTYDLFKIEIPKHVSVPEHSIAPVAEVDEFCKKHYTNILNFPLIDSVDPPAVWLGLRPGMVCKIMCLSENAGIMPIYRYCK